jgi:hypothetical protein
VRESICAQAQKEGKNRKKIESIRMGQRWQFGRFEKMLKKFLGPCAPNKFFEMEGL